MIFTSLTTPGKSGNHITQIEKVLLRQQFTRTSSFPFPSYNSLVNTHHCASSLSQITPDLTNVFQYTNHRACGLAADDPGLEGGRGEDGRELKEESSVNKRGWQKHTHLPATCLPSSCSTQYMHKQRSYLALCRPFGLVMLSSSSGISS